MAVTSQAVHQRLESTAKTYRLSRGARFVLAGTALSLFFLGAFLGLDAWLHFSSAGRWTGLSLTLGSLGGGLLLGTRAWRRKISAAAMARRIEEACGDAGNVLISAVQFDSTLAPDSPLRAALFEEMRDPFPKVRWDAVFELGGLKRLGMVLGALALLILGWAVAKPHYFTNSAARIFLPASHIEPLTRTRIVSITPGNDTVVHGRSVDMAATLGGELPRSAWVYFREPGSSWQKALLDREAGQSLFGFQWKDVRQPLEYYVEAGDAISAVLRLEVRARTAIRTRRADIVAPAYTGLAPQTLENFSVLQNVVPGSAVTLTFDFNNELAELKATDEKAAPISIERLSATRWKLQTRVVSNRTVRLEFIDALGSTDSSSIQVACKPDEAPRITVADPLEGRELAATRQATLSVKFSASDAFGLGSVALYQSTAEKEDAKLIQAWPDADARKDFETTVQVPLRAYGDEDRVTFRVVARDKNDVSGPGVTFSRPIVVTLKSAEKLDKQVEETAVKIQKSLEALLKLQQLNLDQTKGAALKGDAALAKEISPLLERQIAVADTASQLLSAADAVSPEIRNEMRGLLDKEMKDAVLALRNAGSGLRSKFLGGAVALESMILARLQGAPAVAADDAKKEQVADLVSGVEDLLKRQRALHKDTLAAVAAKVTALSDPQDALAEKAAAVKKSVDADSRNASIGDEDFRKRLARVFAMFGELKVYEDMLTAAEHLQNGKVPPAAATQLRAIAGLSKMVELLNQWQMAQAEDKARELKKEAEAMQEKLDKMAEIQREIIEKTKEMARKNEFRPEDIATAGEIMDQKDLMKEVIEQMTTDMHAFPDMKPGNEMKAELVSIFEDVQQADKQAVAEGKLKVDEIAVQKEQGILDAIEAAKKIAADMEMFLPNKNETQKWLLENFDKTEMPEIPNLPLADAMEDIVGDLLESQEKLDAQDAASNQAFAMNPANGWEIRDGPQPGFGAQGKSGNEKPNHNEQMGRSSGGREGMSDGEMAGNEASNLKGDEADTRRTKDPLQQGQVKDDGGIGKTKATGGGKAGGFSDRQGMEGEAPLRAVKAPPNPAADALAVKQALLAQKASKAVGQASLLYMRGDGLAQVARLMDENQVALKEGRLRDSQSIHQKIVGRLRELKNGVARNEVVSFSGAGDTSRVQDKQLLGGSEGAAPSQYKEMVADYFRALVEDK